MAKGTKKAGKKRQPILPPTVEEEDIISDDDVDFIYNELSSGRLNFLARSSTTSKKRRLSEENYELLPRDAEWMEEMIDEGKVHYRLPLKSNEGLLPQDPVAFVDIINEEDKRKEEDSPHKQDEEVIRDDKEEELPHLLSTVELLAKREKKMKRKKDLIADLASRIIEDPQTNVDLLKKLYWLCLDRNPDVALSVRKLAMLSLMAVYRDICPGYYIRELSATEKSVKVSKDVRKLRDFEQKLVQYYSQYVSVLEDTVLAGFKSKNSLKRRQTRRGGRDIDKLDTGLTITLNGLEGLAEVALQCLCELGMTLGHFNFHESVFNILTTQMTSSNLDGKVARMCCEAIAKIFQNDIIGDMSLKIVQLITKMVKAKSYCTKPEVLQTFLHLQLSHVEEPVNQHGYASDRAKKMKEDKRRRRLERQKMTRKQRRKLTARNRLEKELRETEAEERKEKKTHLQTEIIKLVFLTYFRILKNAQDSPLLSAVLEGLAKFAHLISVDYFADLMTVLHTLMEKNNLSGQQTMQCILTTFHILSGQGEALNVDPRQFYCQLYAQLLQLDYNTSLYDMSLVLQCMEKITKQRKQVSTQRVLGFVKRISTMCLQLPPSMCLSLMAIIRCFIQGYPLQCEVLLLNESDEGGDGLFQPHVSDPELSGASSTLLWELATLKRHFDPYISSYSQHLMMRAPSQGPGSLHADFSRKSCVELIASHNWPQVDIFAGVPQTSQRKRKRLYSKELFTSNKDMIYFQKYIKMLSEKADNMARTLTETKHGI